MSEKYVDDADWATAAEQSSEDDEAQEGNVLAAEERASEPAEHIAIHVVDEDDDDSDDGELDDDGYARAVQALGVEALATLQQEGLIREIGVSNANIEEIAVAQEVLGEGGLAAVQNQFSPTFFHTSLLRPASQRGRSPGTPKLFSPDAPSTITSRTSCSAGPTRAKVRGVLRAS